MRGKCEVDAEVIPRLEDGLDTRGLMVGDRGGLVARGVVSVSVRRLVLADALFACGDRDVGVGVSGGLKDSRLPRVGVSGPGEDERCGDGREGDEGEDGMRGGGRPLRCRDPALGEAVPLKRLSRSGVNSKGLLMSFVTVGEPLVCLDRVGDTRAEFPDEDEMGIAG